MPKASTDSEATTTTKTSTTAAKKTVTKKVATAKTTTVKKEATPTTDKVAAKEAVVEKKPEASKETPPVKTNRPVNVTKKRNHNNNHKGKKPMMRSRMSRRGFDGSIDGRLIPDAGVETEAFTGMLELRNDRSGILRGEYRTSDNDAYISASQVRRFHLRPGDIVTGPARKPKENEKYWGLLKIDTVNSIAIQDYLKLDRPRFHRLTPVYPNEQLNLEIGTEPLGNRLINLVAPIGKGQRGLVVSPPKAGKTTILKDIATGIATNHPECHLMAVLIGERPEEVTDIERHIAKITGGKGEVAASNFDEQAAEQARVAELALERARRLVENGADVVIVLDSITRLARAYNLSIPTSGRTLSGGFDPAALYPPKKFFGAARNFEKGGSLTIIGTALVDTGSRMDDLVYEEFKGTGNQELHLDRRLAQRRVYPAIDVQRSSTRRDDLLYDSTTYQSILLMHRMFDMLNDDERTSVFIERLKKAKTNKEFLAMLKQG